MSTAKNLASAGSIVAVSRDVGGLELKLHQQWGDQDFHICLFVLQAFF